MRSLFLCRQLISQQTVEREEKIVIPRKLAERLRRVAPYGQYESLDAFAVALLEEVVAQLQSTTRSNRAYNDYTAAELKEIKEQIKCYSFY